MNAPGARPGLIAAAVVAALGSMNANAQLEEVIVTAQKRAESLQDTAIAITAVSAELMDDLNISSGSDYEAVVPSLSYRGSPTRLFVRGIGRITNSLGTEPGVAVYLDQIYTPDPTVMSRASSLTTERVEILRGPQGTLFGRNATGGAVSVTTKRPTDEFEHHIRGKVGNYGRQDWGVSSAGPITDSLGYRVYAYQNSRDAYTKNLAGKDIWDQDQSGFGAQLSWDVTDTVNIWVNYARDDVDFIGTGVNFGGYSITPYNTELRTADNLILSPAFGWDKENPTVRDAYKVDHSDPLENENKDNNKWTAHVTWDLEPMTIKYIGSYHENLYLQDTGDLDFTSNPDNRIVESVRSGNESTSHEIQFLSAGDGPFQWVGGLYYFNEQREQPYTIQTLVAEYFDNAIPLGSFDSSLKQPNPQRLQYKQNTELDSTSLALYADGNYSFNDQWKLTVGVRYSEDEKEGYEDKLVITDPNIFVPGFDLGDDCCGWISSSPEEANRDLKDDWSNLSGRVVLDYMPTDEHMGYASISTGYKAGGFRLGPIQPDPSFDEENLVSYEIGYKGTFAGVFQVNAAAYFYDYTDMQVLVPIVDETTGIPIEQVINAEEAEVKGVELETIWLATDNLTLMANYSYIDGEYTDFCCYIDTIADPDGIEGEQDLSGNPLTQAPENKLYLNASYAWQTASVGEFVLSGAYSWVDERQYEVWNTQETLADSYYRVDAQLSWFSPSQNIRVILSGKNLTEEFTWTNLQRLNSAGAVNGLPIEPRVYAMEVQFNF